ncbi:hypothetical protein [Acidocella sp.]|nr:hypothetical protein [Acidocella sp.]
MNGPLILPSLAGHSIAPYVGGAANSGLPAPPGRASMVAVS